MKIIKDQENEILMICEAVEDIGEAESIKRTNILTGFALGFIAAKLTDKKIKKKTAHYFIDIALEMERSRTKILRKKRKEAVHEKNT